MSLAQIHSESQKAAQRAAKHHRHPLLVEAEDLEAWRSAGTFPDHLRFPNLGDYVPAGWRKVDELFCDCSGWGSPSEPALTQQQLLASLEPGKGYAITEAGQFQLYLGVFEKKETTGQ